MSRFLIGIDINSSGTGIVILQQRLKGPHWEHSQVVPRAPGDDAAAALEQILEGARHAVAEFSGVCQLALPAEWFMLRSAVLPFARPHKIRQVLPYTLEPGLPLALDDLLLDYTPLSVVEGHQEVLAAALEKSRLAPVLEQLARYKLQPACITISGLAAARQAASAHAPAGELLFIDAGLHHRTIFIFSAGQLHLIRHLTPAEPLEPQVQQTINVFNAPRASGFTPHRVIVSGACFADPSSLATLAEDSGTIVEVFDSRAVGRLTATPPALFPEFNNLWCLALATTQGTSIFNFSTRRSLIQKTWRNHRTQLVLSFVLVMLVAMLGITTIWLETRHLEKQAAGLLQEATKIFQQTFPHETVVVDPLQQMRIALREAREQTRTLPDVSVLPVIDLLTLFSQSLPDEIDVNLQHIGGGDNLVMITGETSTFNAVEAIKNHFEKIEVVKAVTITSAAADKTGNRINFRLRVQL